MYNKLTLSCLVLFIAIGIQQCDASIADAIEHEATARKVPIEIQPGDVDPGDAAAAGYDEDFSIGDEKHIWKFEIEDPNSSRTYIYSAVWGVPGSCSGYFRVLWSYGYSRILKHERKHLVYAEQLPCPAGEHPLRQFVTQQGTIIAIFMNDFFGIYRDGAYIQNKLKIIHGNVGENDVADLDGDGYLEVKVMNGIPNIGSQGPVFLEIYRYIPWDQSCQSSTFQRLKGRSLEHQFLDHANKMKSEGQVAAWLAAIESTEDPNLIKQALDEFLKEASSGSEHAKLLDKLVNAGYSGLGMNR